MTTPAVRTAMAAFHKALATRKTRRLIEIEQGELCEHPDLDHVIFTRAQPKSEPEDRRSLAFRGILIALPVGLLLWWLIWEAVR